MGFLSSIGALVLIGGGLYLLLLFLNHRENEDRHNKELAKHVNLSTRYFDKNKSYEDNLRRVFSDKELKKEAEESLSRSIERDLTQKEKERREKTIERVYAYKYEDLLFRIYAPFARKDRSFYDCHFVCLEKDFVISEIERILGLLPFDSPNAHELFNEFIEKGALQYKFRSEVYVELGHVLNFDWDIISKDDMNINKWIAKNGMPEDAFETQNRRKSYDVRNYYSYIKFIEIHGQPTWGLDIIDTPVLRFPDDKEVSLRYLDKVKLPEIEQMKENLYVVEDDGCLSIYMYGSGPHPERILETNIQEEDDLPF